MGVFDKAKEAAKKYTSDLKEQESKNNTCFGVTKFLEKLR